MTASLQGKQTNPFKVGGGSKELENPVLLCRLGVFNSSQPRAMGRNIFHNQNTISLVKTFSWMNNFLTPPGIFHHQLELPEAPKAASDLWKTPVMVVCVGRDAP